ncbi:MAG: UDP-3-O-(3-hydroxymyristoyl)glucosamine N-acyltransferase [Bacteroidia bacterium]
MKLEAQFLVQRYQGILHGNPHAEITGFNTLEKAQTGDLAFFHDNRYASALYATAASVVLVPHPFKPAKPFIHQPTLIEVEHPQQVFFDLVKTYASPYRPPWGKEEGAFIHPTAQVHEKSYVGAFAYIGAEAVIEENVYVYPFAYVGERTYISQGTILYPHAIVMAGTYVGKNCIIQPGAVIGADGFGYYEEKSLMQKIPQIGRVYIEDEVEIGANTCIDRATLGETHIAQGVKLDNLIQVGHNVQIGTHTAIAALTGIAGSAKIGKFCRIGGQVGIMDHIQIADHTAIGAQSGVSKSFLQPHRVLRGSPAQELKAQLIQEAILRRLPHLYQKLLSIEKEFLPNPDK